jgi:hypothetical protein
MKKTRLFEIIREEIINALNEKTALGPGALGDKDFQKAFTKLPGDEKEKVKKGLQAGTETFVFEEDLLNETPVYDVIDMEGFQATLDKFREEGVSRKKPLNLLLKKLEDEGTVDTNALSKEYGVDTATFNDTAIRKFLNRPKDEKETDKSGNELIDFSPYLKKSDKKRGRVAGEKPEGEATPNEPKEKTAIPDSGITKKEPAKVEPKEKPEPRKEPAKTEPKAEPAKAEPKAKESSEDKANRSAAAGGGGKLEKMSNDKDALLKAIAKSEKERAAIAQKRKDTKDEGEKAKLFDKLKELNRLEGELQNRVDKLGY